MIPMDVMTRLYHVYSDGVFRWSPLSLRNTHVHDAEAWFILLHHGIQQQRQSPCGKGTQDHP
jgi:hypothetical protein